MPLIYKRFTTFKGPAWYLSDSVYVETIYDEDYGAFQREAPAECKDNVSISSRCVYVTDPQFTDFDLFARQMATKVKFVLNHFSAAIPVSFPWAVLINIGGKSKCAAVAEMDAPNLSTLKGQAYSFRANSSRRMISKYFQVVEKACSDTPAVFFTLERFNSSLTKPDEFDRIVDITISLESLISGTQEVRHRFALYNAFIAEREPK